MGGGVGGIVNIIGINGNTNDFSLQTNINNFTLNSLVEIPLFKKSSLSLAYRHTYYNLYNPETYTITGNNANNEVPIEISVVPDYSFRDLNVKYSTMGKNGNIFYISLFGAGDKFGYTITEDISSNKKLFKSADEDNQQLGMSLYYGKNWKKGNRSSFILSLGSLASVWNDEYTVTNINNGDTVWNSDHVSGNNTSEFNMTFEHHIVLNNSHTLEFAATFIANNSQLTYDSVDVRKLNILTSSARLNGYLQDRISIGEHIELIPGIRINYAAIVNKIMGEPRLTGSFSFEFKSIQMETGISILNLLNTKNLKTSNLELANYGGTNTATLFTQAIPFTPTVNFKVFL